MKKTIWLSALFITLLLVFSACTKEGGDSLVDSANLVIPTDDEVALAYSKASEAMGWFEVFSLPVDYESSKEVDNLTYYKVVYDEIKTLKDLEDYLKTLFVDSIVDNLIETGDKYLEFDGILYSVDGARGSDISKGEETYEIARESDVKIIYKVTVENLDIENLETVTGHEIHDMIYENINGKWVFSKFELVR